MKTLARIMRFWYDFIVGDDWTIAVAVLIGLVLTHLLISFGVAGWWLLPTIVIPFLGLSLFRSVRA